MGLVKVWLEVQMNHWGDEGLPLPPLLTVNSVALSV